MNDLTWVEIDAPALTNNIRRFRALLTPGALLCACVKANAYGHGLVEAARTFCAAGADWLSVNCVAEAAALRRAGITCPICILGYVPFQGLDEALALDCRMVVYNSETVARISRKACRRGVTARLHIKVETGTNRQGVPLNDLVDFARRVQLLENCEIEGVSTHFANIEDTTDHSFAELQLQRFDRAVQELAAAGIRVPLTHCANSAATILFPHTHRDMVRVGISAYGMWPSSETYVSHITSHGPGMQLLPAFTWKAKIAQIKSIPSGEYIGYGCTCKTTHATRLAIIPVGYYDGYDRGVHGAFVLIHGRRAPLCGRVCMNMIMADITDIDGVQLEDEAILIGRNGTEAISAERFAQWAGTINYEVTTRVNDRIPRVLLYADTAAHHR